MENWLLWIGNLAEEGWRLFIAIAQQAASLIESGVSMAMARAATMSLAEWSVLALPLAAILFLLALRQGRRIARLERLAGMRAMNDLRGDIDHLESILTAHHQEIEALKSHFVHLRLERQGGQAGKAKAW
ncbi:MAG: hypothetical protein KIT20_04930 [Alphaproteobacteria bacterium]|nr:hypothetical protein [Alphaproteobacteria bacterium]